MKLKKLLICSAFLLGACAFNPKVYANDSVGQTNVVDQVQSNLNNIDGYQCKQDSLSESKVEEKSTANQNQILINNNESEITNNKSTSSDISNYTSHKSAIWNNGWTNEYGTWYYTKSDGTRITSNDASSNGWVYINGVPYLFDQYGALLTNTKEQVQGKYYILDENGGYRRNTWYRYAGDYYYLKADGSAVTSLDRHQNGWEYINGVPYLFNQYGGLLTNTKEQVQGKYYILDENGGYRRNTWYRYAGDYYYLKANGSAVTSLDRHQNGWEYINGVPYLFNQYGGLLTNTKEQVQGKYYILDENGGYRRNTWYRYAGDYYYLKADGSAVTSLDRHQNGWEYINGVPYLFNQYGGLLTNTKEQVQGKYYILDENGGYRRNTWYRYAGNYYYLKADGSAVTKLDAKNGWVYVAGKPYIFDRRGNLLTDQQVNVYGRIYYVDGNGNYITNKWMHGDYYGSNGEKIS